MTTAPRRTATAALRIVLGDQLSPSLAALAEAAPGDVVLMAEVMGECTYVRHHPKKIVLVLSAMRHFAAGLGRKVDYIRLDDPANTQTLTGEVARAVARHRPARIIVTEPGEWRVLEEMRGWDAFGVPLEILPDGRFLCGSDQFRAWAADRRTLRMEFFYRDMRRRHHVLMDGDAPAGGKWNFDADNRKRIPPSVASPDLPAFAPDAVTREVMTLVAARFGDHFGAVDGFALPVTAADAQANFEDFLHRRLASFGDWQDAMRAGGPVLFHALVSTSMNIGLLDPGAMCRAVEDAWRAGAVPLNAAEGFIRQILGWREFLRGVYWLHMPGYATLNALDAQRKLPSFYWSGDTRMRCLAQVIGQTRDLAYAHHIQRLMVTGNFALIAGIDPAEVDEWYLIVFADAYEWVEMPNTRGMSQFADGGIVGSKPYAASGAYINRMSDYCRGCAYDVRAVVGKGACPFNALYWDFIARHDERWAANNRMDLPMRNWQRMTPERQQAIRAQAQDFLHRMDAGEQI